MILIEEAGTRNSNFSRLLYEKKESRDYMNKNPGQVTFLGKIYLKTDDREMCMEDIK